jgi:serine/threonine protein kinase
MRKIVPDKSEDSVNLQIWYNSLLKTKLKSSSCEYQILEHMGPSGHGEIFLAITNDHFLVGIKIIMNKDNMENELAYLRNINKKIQDVFLPFLDYFIIQNQDEKYYAIVSKFFEGYVSLKSYLDKNLFHVEQLEKLKITISDHIQHLHDKVGCVHNDIGNHNILIHSKTLHIRIFDLGYCIPKFGFTEEEFGKLVHKDFSAIKKIQ